MDIDALVEKIVAEVLRRLSQQSATPGVLILAERGSDGANKVIRQLAPDTVISFWGDHQTLPPPRTILPSLSCGQMADLALGRAGDDPVLEKVLAELLCGRVVEVFEYEYLSYQSTAPESLMALYRSYEQTLSGFGIKPFVLANQDRGNQPTPLLLTEADVIRAHQQGSGSIQLEARTIVTPLAADCAKAKKIRLLH